jgi:outer membrane receptor protein involved in Fe transport
MPSWSRTVTTNETGGYDIPTVPTGTYEVKVSMAGFKTFTQTDIPALVNDSTRVNVTLELGELTETVTVAADIALLQTDRAEVKSELVNKVLRDLPVPPGRNYQGLFGTLPGITPPSNAHSIPSNPSRALTFNVNGATHGSNNIRIDGASQYNIWLPHVTAYVPALESIETVNIVTNSFDAESGLAAGAAVNVQVKSGTNDLHGSAFWYHNDNATKAKPFFLPQGQRNPKLVYNQFGATAGGPIKKDRVFYFVSYEGTTDRQFASRLLTLPTDAMRRGDFSASPNPIYDPDTGNPATGAGRTAFVGNIIPDSRIDPIVKKILPLIPALTYPNQLTNNFFAQGPFSFTRNTLDSKVNWNATPKLSMYGRFSVLKYDMSNPGALGELDGVGVSTYAGNTGLGDGSTYGTTIAGTYAFSPNFIVDANFGYTRMYTAIEQGRLDENVGLDFLGIPGTNGPRRFEGGWPRFRIGPDTYANLGVQDNFMPYYRTDPQYVYVANANWTKKAHNIRFGLDFANQHMNHTQPEFPGATHGAQGGFDFAGGPTQTQGGPASNQFNNFATFLLGLPTTTGKILQVPDVYATRTKLYSFYVRDQWQVSPKLTLNFGLRYEYFPMPTRADRGIERYDFENNTMLVCGVGVVPTDCGVELSKTLFAPRFGLAYRLTDTWVVRAGYGLTNDPYNLARPLRTNYPIFDRSQYHRSQLSGASRSAAGWHSDFDATRPGERHYPGCGQCGHQQYRYQV